jgi:hypothetical protein
MSSITRLLTALELDYAAANRLLIAAGFAPTRPALAWDDPRFADARHAIELVLAKHEPFPAMIVDRGGDVLERTKGLDAILTSAGMPDAWERTGQRRRPNLYDLSLHPKGIVTLLANPQEVVPHTLRRLSRAATSHPAAAITYERVRRYPAARRWPPSDRTPLDTGVVTEEYLLGKRRLRFVSATASFASPEDVTAQEVQIELLYPADTASETTVAELTR